MDLGSDCERCGRPGEVFYYKGVEAILCGECLPHLEEIVDAKIRQNVNS